MLQITFKLPFRLGRRHAWALLARFRCNEAQSKARGPGCRARTPGRGRRPVASESYRRPGATEWLQGGAVSVSVVRGFALAALTRPAGTGQAAAAACQRPVEHTLNRAADGGLPRIRCQWCLALAGGRKDRPELGWGAASMVAASTVAASTVAVTPKCDADCHVCFEKVRFNLSLPFQRFSENCQSGRSFGKRCSLCAR